jgi:rSAM/selenodomain-associated transferase 1
LKPAIVVFAREPVPGRVKTRLAEAIGGRAAARVYEILLDRTLSVVTATDCTPVVSLADAAAPTWIDRLGVRWELQRGADLGSRMADAFERRFREDCERVVIVGSDCPQLHSRHLHEALDALESAPIALGPARDGGYWLVAQRRPGIDLFSGVSWSSPDTLDTTRRRLEEIGATWHEIETLDDVDTNEDLQKTLSDPAVDPELRRKLEDALGGATL